MITIPSLPDSINKLFLSLALILIGFGFYSIYFPSKDHKWKQELEKRKMDIVNEQYATLNQIKKKNHEIVLVSRRVSRQNNVPSPFELVNDSLIEAREFNTTRIDSIIQDSLFAYMSDRSILSRKYSQSFQKQMYTQELIYGVDDYAFENVTGAVACIVLGFFFLYTGLKGWYEDESKIEIVPGTKPIKNYSLFCQSCARNFTYFLKRGTTKKGKRSKLFCSDCYSNGEFTDFMSEDRIQEYKSENLRGRKRKERKRIKQRFDSLIRWKKDQFEAIN